MVVPRSDQQPERLLEGVDQRGEPPSCQGTVDDPMFTGLDTCSLADAGICK